MRVSLVLGLMTLLAAACGASDSDRVVLLAGTTLVDSGFANALVDEFTSQNPGVEVSVVAAPTSEALALADRGAADVTITHQPDLEASFLEEHPAARSAAAFTSHFLLVGPPDAEPIGRSVVEAFSTIAGSPHPFVTRADGSGTHFAEMQIWSIAGIDPTDEAWYTATGQGMGFTLQVADQRRAYTLTEQGAFLAASPVLSLTPVLSEGALLENPYTVIVGDPGGAPGAVAFVEWLVSDRGSRAIIEINRALFGTVVYRAFP